MDNNTNRHSNEDRNNSDDTGNLLIQDKEFLLRCALTYNWDVLINFCSVILEVLTSSVRDRDYYRHQRQVNAAKDQLTRQDQWGNTALHASCYNKPPLRAVTSLLDCASAALLFDYHLILTRDSSTPLNIACATGASTDVIRVLLHPPGASGTSMQHCYHGGIAVSIPDARGCTPLSELVIFYELQRKSPWYRNALPLDQVQLISRDNSRTTSRAIAPGQQQQQEPLLESFWTHVELLLRSAWSAAAASCQSAGTSPWISIVHGAALSADACPKSLTSLICRSYPAMISFANRKGILPLHMAVQPRSQSQDANTPDQRLPMDLRRTFLIRTLVETYPAGVLQPFPSNGRSIFCQAIASGLYWHTEAEGKEEEIGPLQYLWKNDPEALCTCDVVTGLYPFSLAAAVAAPTTQDKIAKKKSCQQHGPEQTTVLQLDTIFCLLRLHPQLLGSCVNFEG